jgi:ubiquitin C-terminal hydrolase
VSIYDCLDEYFKEEALPDVNCARCSLEKYKSGLSVGVGSEIIGSYYDNDDKLFDALGAAYTVKREALKRLGVARLPELLCLHLSRRVIDLLRGEIVKIDTHVQFPLELNMDRYLSFSTSNSVFKLVSVIHHIGTAHAGMNCSTYL